MARSLLRDVNCPAYANGFASKATSPFVTELANAGREDYDFFGRIENRGIRFEGGMKRNYLKWLYQAATRMDVERANDA